jgi:uncharacterized protein (DUF885 family)
VISPRTSTAIDAAADAYLEDLIALDPVEATLLGLRGHEDELTDYSPDGHHARAELARNTLGALGRLPVTDDVDAVTLAAMRERLELAVDWHEAGLDAAELNNVACPVQHVREVFDVSATATVEDWQRLSARLRAVPRSLAGYRAGLDAAPPEVAAASRQVRAAAGQAAEFAEPHGFFLGLPSQARTADGEPLPPALAGELATAAAAAAQAYAELASWLRERLLPRAPDRDPVGRDAYPLHSRVHLGTAIDPEPTYAWGLEELASIERESAEVAREIVPGAAQGTAVLEAMDALDADPSRRIEGAEAFRGWMQELSDTAVADLADVEFEIPAEIRSLICRIAPSTSGAIYYTGPTEDFSRPGQMWWAVPKGVTSFSTWREASTVYHEGVPGHHLQIARAAVRTDRLNRWRRQACWVSGHGEGWALYAERLMAERGHLADPGDRMGQLDAQALRAARVVVDIGVHCELPAPAEVGGGVWDADKAWQYLRAHTHLPDANLRFERDRYLGWPGQAPSYKIGERVWLELREAAARRGGADFDLRDFHDRALDLGSVGLDVLRRAMLAPQAPA